MSKEQINAVFNLICSRSFERWYENSFLDYISGEECAPDKAQILQWLADHLPADEEDEDNEPDWGALWYDTSAELN